jgi:flagellar protein FliL
MAASAKQATPEAADAAAEGDAKPKGFFTTKMIIILAVAVVAVGGGAGGFFVFRGSKEAKPAVPLVKPLVFFDVPDVLVNLAAASGERTQYLKVKIVLELPDASVQPQVQSTMPRVMDAFQTYLRELRPNDLDGSAGLYRLKEELTRRVNAAVAPGRINAVLFKEIIVQ